MRTHVLTLVVSLSLAASACNDSGPSARGAASDLASAVCDLVFACCSRGELDVMVGPYVADGENCTERLVNTAALANGANIGLGAFDGGDIVIPNLADLQRAIDDGRTKVDNAALSACLEHIDAIPCNAVEEEDPAEGCVPPELPEETPCDSALMFLGQVGNGGACSSPGTSFECKQGLACRTGGALGVEGACVRPGDEGDLCFFDAECHEDLYCSQLDGTCQVPRAAGETCLFADPEDPAPSTATLLIECAEGLSCDPVTDTCVAPCERGAGCSDDGDCDEEQGLTCVIDRCDSVRPEGLPCGADDDCADGLQCAFDPQVGEAVCSPRLANGEPCAGFGADDSCASGFCDPVTDLCAATSAAGGLCESANHAQCEDSYCETTFVSCVSDGDCPGSGTCNTGFGRCEYYCVAHRADGAMCTLSEQCASGACIDAFCRTLPLADGQPCSSNAQCASEFCGLDFPRVCESLPLANGKACSSASQCASSICFGGECTPGLAEGAGCGDFDDPPCGAELYCSAEESPPVCVPVLDAGALCEGSFQCRGTCVISAGRFVCDATPPAGGATCDGA